MPGNVAVDDDGNPTTDPDKAMKGGLLPFNHSYKGAGVEMFASPFIGVPLLTIKHSKKNEDICHGN